MDARKILEIDIVILKTAGNDLAPVVFRAHARLPGPVSGLKLKRPVARKRLLAAFK